MILLLLLFNIYIYIICISYIYNYVNTIEDWRIEIHLEKTISGNPSWSRLNTHWNPFAKALGSPSELNLEFHLTHGIACSEHLQGFPMVFPWFSPVSCNLNHTPKLCTAEAPRSLGLAMIFWWFSAERRSSRFPIRLNPRGRSIGSTHWGRGAMAGLWSGHQESMGDSLQ